MTGAVSLYSLTAGSFLTSAGTFDGAAARTFAVDATDAATASKVVARDASGNFAAAIITANQFVTTAGNAVVGAQALSIAHTGDNFSGGFDTSAGNFYVLNITTGKSLVVNRSLLTANMTVREIDVCDAGVAKKMLIVGSAPY